MLSITTISYSICINGEISEKFVAKRGFRQGDARSPYLFVMIMEYLHRLLQRLKRDPNFNFHPKCEKMNLIHLFFAVDLLLFSRGDVISVQMLNSTHQVFSKATGLQANLTKSQVYFEGVSSEVKIKFWTPWVLLKDLFH